MNVFSCTGYLEWVTEDRGSRAYAEESLHRHKACFFPVPCEQSVPCEKRGQLDKIIRFERKFFHPRALQECHHHRSEGKRKGVKERMFVLVKLSVSPPPIHTWIQPKESCTTLDIEMISPKSGLQKNSGDRREAWPWSDHVALRDRMTILFHFLLHHEMWNLASSKHRQVAASALPASKQQRLPASLACFDALLYYQVSCAYATFRSKNPCSRCRQIFQKSYNMCAQPFVRLCCCCCC